MNTVESIGRNSQRQIRCPLFLIYKIIFSKSLISTPICNQSRTKFDGQTPLSQIISIRSSPIIDSSSFDFDRLYTKQSTIISKRGILPKNATSIMRSWLFQHIVRNNNQSRFKILFFIRYIHIQLKMKNEQYLVKQIYHYFKSTIGLSMLVVEYYNRCLKYQILIYLQRKKRNDMIQY